MGDAKTFKDLIKQMFTTYKGWNKEIHSIYVEEFDYSSLMSHSLKKRIIKMLEEEEKE